MKKIIDDYFKTNKKQQINMEKLEHYEKQICRKTRRSI